VQNVDCCPDELGGVVATYQIRLDWANYDVMAKRCNADGTLGGPIPFPIAHSGGEIQGLSLNQISYVLLQSGEVRIELFDLLGRRLALLKEGYQAAGSYILSVDDRGLSSGVYLIRLAGEFGPQVGKVVVVR
jgi:hypothetical protein